MSEKSHIATSNNQLNKLRASVLGANDGIVSTAGLVLGVTGAAASKETILLAGFAGLVAGAISMAAGEFVSVSSQRDSEKAFLNRTKLHIKKEHASELDELVEIYQAKGLSSKTAIQAARELQQSGTLMIELEKELGIDPDDLTNPWSAAIASAISFVIGAAVPLAAIALTPTEWQVPATTLAVLVSLVLAGILSARAGEANKTRAALRIVVWGVGAMVVTYVIGHLVGVSLG
ncbi:MAG TPA: VIT family protein [Candidatus Saccharibacteria bacterium]|nr:VIT family protein [Candidatus Saccharibacteria bacterium]